MPTVPRSTGPTVRTQILPGVQLDSSVDSRGTTAIANAAQRVGGMFGEMYQEEKAKDDEAAVFEARTKLAEWERNWFDPDNEQGVYSSRGKNARDLPDRLLPDFKAKVAEITGTLRNSDQQAAFNRMSFQFGEEVTNRVNSFVLKENEAYVESTEKASLASMTERAATAAREGRWDVMGQEVALAHAQLDLRAQRRGLAPEVAEAEKQAFSSQAMVAATNGLIESGDYAGAVAFYKDNAEDMLEADRSKMDGVIRNADLLVRETSETEAIVAQYGTGSAAVKAAEAISDPILRDKVISNIDREANRRERAANEADRAMRGQAYQALFQADPAAGVEQVIPPAVLARMDPQEIIAMQGFQDRRLARTETRTDPRVFERLATLPPDQLATTNLEKEYVEGRLGLADMEQLRKRQQAILNPDPAQVPRSATEAEILGQTFRTIGLSPTGKKDEAKRGQFRSEYYQAERQAVKEKGRELTQDEQEVLANQLALRVSRTKPGWFWDSTETRSLYEIPAAERGAFTVPEATRARILADAKAQGYDTLTDEQVREAYVRNAEFYNRQDGEQ